ncbi:unnamed protein product [Penicillium manginii]
MSSQANLHAVYTAPDTDPKTFSHEFPSTDVPKIQDEINVYLTARMEEDKKAQGTVSEKEAKEEDYYGEELVEEDA